MGEIISIENDIIKEQIVQQIEDTINSLKKIRNEFENYLNFKTKNYFSQQHLIALPKGIQFAITRWLELISTQGLNESFFLNRIDRAIEEINERKFNLLADNNEAISLMEKLFESIDKNDNDNQLFINKIQELSSSNPFAVITCKDNSKPFYNQYFNYVSISFEAVRSENITLLAHELGHMLHYQVLDGAIPNNFEEIINYAGKEAFESGKLEAIIDKYREFRSNANAQANRELDINIKPQEFFALQKEFIKAGKRPFTSLKDARQEIYSRRVTKNSDRIIRSAVEFTSQMADIIMGVYKGERFVGSNDLHCLTGGHSIEYYAGVSPFAEMIANFTALKVTGKKHDLQLLKETLGDDFYNMLNTTFKSLIQPTFIKETELEDNSKKIHL